MACFNEKVLVLGGESIEGQPDNPSLIHVLDTGAFLSLNTHKFYRGEALTALDIPRCRPSAKIKYPKDPSRPSGQNPVHRKSSAPVLNQNQAMTSAPPPRSASAQGQSPNAPSGPTSPPPHVRALSPLGNDRGNRSIGQPPTRPRREGDELHGVGDPNRARSPPVPGGSGSGSSRAKSPSDAARPPRTTSTDTDSPTQRDFPRSQSNQQHQPMQLNGGPPLGPEVVVVGRDSPAGTLSPAFSPNSINNGQMSKPNLPSQLRGGKDGRSPSPIVTDPALHSSASSSFPPPADAFHQPRSPILANGHGRQGSLSGVAGADLMREMKAREVEVDSLKKREKWLKAELARAAKSGFVIQSSVEEGKVALEDIGADGSELRKVVDSLIALKKERALLQVRPLCLVRNF